MRSRDFCFWLQGAFEICEPEQLDERQIEQIKTHLDIVAVSQKDVKDTSPAAGFCRSLRIILDGQTTLEGDPLRVVKKLLNAEFVHIDADTEGDQGAMNQIHNQGRPPGGVLRC